MPVTIISWNIKNLGKTKLNRNFTPVVAGAAVGGNVLDYIVRVTLGNVAWNFAPPVLPADVLVVIEPTSGGNQKGAAATGSGKKALKRIAAALSLASGNVYARVPPLLVGTRETIGIIYNTATLALVNSGVVRRANNGNPAYLLPRTPFMADFTTVVGGNPIRIIGNHAPPVSGSGTTLFKDPIDYCIHLADVPEVNNVSTILAGDFNCSPTNTYQGNTLNKATNKKQAVTRSPFTTGIVANYTAGVPGGAPASLSSTKTPGNSVNAPVPGGYLANAYDNILYYFNPPLGVPPVGAVLDLIHQHPLFATNFKAVVNNYWKVTNHMPVYLEY